MRIVWGCLSAAAIVPLAGLFLLPVWRDDARFDDFRDRVLAYHILRGPPGPCRDSAERFIANGMV
ncbi:hypothetical protein ACIBF7_20375 [Nonomuraea sp. NPDC050478]|uniref:hypothetical protein n=1 Tax=Nonomuraea sp. NPDC050478 TaxID=3364365 RepID=UPI00379A12E6